MGFPQVGYQAFKLLAHQRLHEAVAHWKDKYPGVDIILIEPGQRRADVRDEHHELTRRVEIAKHGFESVTLKLASSTTSSRRPCARHGIEISATRVRKVVKSEAENREEDRRLAAHPRRPPARCFARAIRRKAARVRADT